MNFFAVQAREGNALVSLFILPGRNDLEHRAALMFGEAEHRALSPLPSGSECPNTLAQPGRFRSEIPRVIDRRLKCARNPMFWRGMGLKIDW